MMANLTFNGTDLSAIGFSIAGFDRSAPGNEEFTVDMSLREYIDRWNKRYSNQDLVFPGMFSQPTRSGLLTAYEQLVEAVSPELGWCELRVVDVSSRHMIAQGNGVQMEDVYPMFKRPFLPVQLSFKRLAPYWYADVPVTGTIPGTIVNGGHVKAYPVWTAVVGAGGEPAGFAFTVESQSDSQTFQYLAALNQGDVVTIDTDPAILRTQLNYGGVAPNALYAYTEYPYVELGSSVCTVYGNVTVSYSFSERYLVGA